MLTPRFLFRAAKAAKQTRWGLRHTGLRGLATAPVPPTPASTDVIRKLLSIVSSDADVAEYKATYGTPGVRRTTVIKIGGEVLENEMDTLVASLTFLKEAGLFPILVHGAGPQMNDELEKAGVEPRYVQGNRYTDKTTLGIAKKVFLAANRKLVNALSAAGVPARPITSGVFEAAVRDLDVFGYVGEVDTIHGDAVRSALDAGQIPVLSCLGESKDGQLLNINADVAARELAITLQPHKTIFINAKGGWLEDGVKLPKLDMSKDYASMAARDYTGRQGTLLKLNEINTLLQALPSTSSVVLTSAAALANEIVSGHSAGTVCIRGGHDVDAPLHFSSGKKKVGLMGARGYVGRELIRVLGGHPELDLVVASSRALVGQKVLDLATAPPLNPHTNRPATGVYHTPLRLNPELAFSSLDDKDLATSPIARDVDVWVLALPNGMCQQYATALDALNEPNQVVIDLSADQRFNRSWVYGLPETPGTREKLIGATRISNPGCYATGAQLGVLPLLPYLDAAVPPHVFGVSGYSGAGTGLSPNNDETVLHDNLLAYKSVEHIHEKEVSHQLGTRVAFMPHVAPWFQGIHLTLSLQLTQDLSDEAVAALYESFYANEPLVHVQSQGVPQVKTNACQHHATIGGFSVDRLHKRVALVVTIDNLLKGAASQAMQNINLALGMDERLGLH